MAKHSKENKRVVPVVIFTVTHECAGDDGAGLHFTADIVEGFQAHMRECENCRLTVAKSLLEFADQLMADRIPENMDPDACLTVN